MADARPRVAIPILQAFERADPVATNELVGALGVERARLTADSGVARTSGHELSAAELHGIGTRARDAHLPAHAVAVGAALIAALPVDAADLADGAIAVVSALLL